MDSTVGSDWLRAGRPRGRSSSLGTGKIFIFSTSSRSALGLTQPPIQRVPWALSPGVKPQGVKRTAHLKLYSAEVKKRGYIHPLPYIFMA
jgi:hypothetical protein